MHYIVTAPGFISDELKKFKGQKGFTFITAKELAASTLSIKKDDKVYVPIESGLATVLLKLEDDERKRIIVRLKDKFACRSMLKSLFPNFYFHTVSLKELSSVKFDANKKYVVKPRMGFFNAGVRIFTGKDDIAKLQQSISAEVTKSAKYFSPTVLSTTEMLIEEYVDGIEFAVDMYYSSTGKPVIINIYKHPESKYKEYFHAVYYSDATLFDTYFDQLTNVFKQLNRQLHATSLPVHAEFKYANGQFVPIEFNPLRYGGMGLADTPKYAYGFDPFLSFFNDDEPDWEKIWATRRNNTYAWVLGYNGTRVDVQIQKPDHEKLKKTLGSVLHYNKLGYKKLPVFANAYIETNKQKVTELLGLEFNNYFTKPGPKDAAAKR